MDVERRRVSGEHLLAGTTFVGSVTKVTVWTLCDTLLMAFALTDKVEHDLHLLSESQGLYLNGLYLGVSHSVFWTALRCHTDGEHDLRVKGYRAESDSERKVPSLLSV